MRDSELKGNPQIAIAGKILPDAQRPSLSLSLYPFFKKKNNNIWTSFIWIYIYVNIFRQNGKESSVLMNINKSTVLHTQVFGSKKSGSKRFSWSKLSWKACEQEECAICLERFKVGATLVHLPCAHRFHARCLLPWLATNAHNCPCCRMQILDPAASSAD